jgi:hypothetical protein
MIYFRHLWEDQEDCYTQAAHVPGPVDQILEFLHNLLSAPLQRV